MVPDGPLHRVPWDLLRLPDGRYVVERYAVSVAPSAAILATLWRHPRAGTISDQPARLLAFGDPAFPREPKPPRTTPGALPPSRPSWMSRSNPYVGPAATRARHYRASRGRAARHGWWRATPPSEVRLRQAASAGYLKHAPLERFRVIHFATHAVVDERSAARTVLALAPDGSGDGTGRAGRSGRAPASMRTSSFSPGCRTAGGVLVEGEGVQGLTAPLIQAGARSVVASQWRIGDRGTIAFVQAFYQALAEGLPVGDALRAAKLDALRRGAPPREWAAFTVVGDPLVRVALRAPSSTPPGSIAALGALLLGVGGIAYWRARRRADSGA